MPNGKFAFLHLPLALVRRFVENKMKRKHRTTTFIDQHEMIVLRSSRPPRKVYCAECSEMVAFVSLDEAVRISGVSSRHIFRLIEEGQIHFRETAQGMALICPTSLLKWVKQEQCG